MAFTLWYPQRPSTAASVSDAWKPSTYARAMSVARSGSSPKVPLKRNHRGSVARSICGESAVAIPSARYSLDAISPNCCTRSGSNVAARPIESGHIEISPPEPALNSASARARCRGSELLLAGIPSPVPSTSAWTLLFHRAAASGLSTEVISTCLTRSLVRKSLWLSERSQAFAPLSANGLPPYVGIPNGLGVAGIA